MTKEKAIESFLSEIYIPASMKVERLALLDFIRENPIRSINSNDAGRIGYSMLRIKTKGKGTRETFQSWEVMRGDIYSISDRFALIALYDEDGNATPIRVSLDNPRVAIIINQ